VPTVRLLETVGMDPVIALARRMGIKSELRREYGLALGVSEVTLLELTGAYAVLGNQGLRMPRRGSGGCRAEWGGPGGGGGRAGTRPAGGGWRSSRPAVLQGAVSGDGQAGARAGVERGGEDGHQPGRAVEHVVRRVHAPARRRSVGRLRSATMVGSHETAGRLVGAGVGGLHARALRRGAPGNGAHSGGDSPGARELPDRRSDTDGRRFRAAIRSPNTFHPAGDVWDVAGMRALRRRTLSVFE